MSPIAVPNILDRLARAGDAGLALPLSDSDCAQLQLCRDWGFRFDVDDERVRLPFDHDQLVPAWIAAEVPAVVWEQVKVEGFLETGSTNDEALMTSRLGAAGGTVIYAETQTSGKGRTGRQWISPPGKGLYFSLILRPEQDPSSWALLTHVASLALALTLKELSQAGFIPRPLDVELKWPNDVLISGKKTAGILLETTGTGGAISAAVVGVGVNVNRVALPEHIQGRVTSISEAAGTQVPRRQLMVRFLYHFQIGYDLFARGEHRQILEQWKNFSRMCTNTPVWIKEGEQAYPAVTAGLTESGALLVRTQDGAQQTILAADVSIRQWPYKER